MKQLTRILAGTLLVVAGIGGLRAESVAAKVQGGSGQFSVDGQQWTAVQTGTAIPQGATIKTDAAAVDLYLGANGPLLRVCPKSEVTLTALTRSAGAGETIANTEVSVQKGQVVGLTSKVNKASRYEVKTGKTTTAIKGTKFAANCAGQVSVKEGLASVLYTAVAGTTAARFELRDGLRFDPQGNAGQGSVYAMTDESDAELNRDLDNLVDSLRVGLGRYAPTPVWLSIKRPFEYVGAAPAGDPAFVTPGVTFPTTPGTLPPISPVTPPPNGGGNEGGE